MEKLRIGFIGNGKSANRYHAPFILSRPETLQITQIYNPTISHDLWKEIPNVKYTDNLDEFLTSEDVDVVVVSTPPKFHYEYAKKALEAGKHCVCEKPFMETLEQAREIYALAKERGLYVQAYQNRRFDSDFLTAQKVIESGKLGDLLEVEMHFDYYRPEVPENTKEFVPGLSYLYSLGCHTLDQVISYFGEPEKIHYDVRQLLGEGRMNDYFDLDFHYGALKVSVKSSYYRIKSRPSIVVYGKKGMFEHVKKDKQEEHLKNNIFPGQKGFGEETPDEYGTLSYYDDMGVYHEEKVPSVKGDYAYYYDKLYETIVLGQEKLVKDEETLLQLQILEKGISFCK